MLKKEVKLSQSQIHFLIVSFYLIPAIALIAYILRFGVNAPFYDQWVLPELFEKFKTGNLSFSDLFELHNNHRILFPRLIFIGLGFLSNWNIKLELIFSWGLSVLTFASLYYLSCLNSQEKVKYIFHLANFLTCILIFSWIQYENWFWGFQIALFLINLCVVLAVFILQYPKLNHKTKLRLAAIFCGIASFSSAQGLVSWLAVFPSVLSLAGKKYQKQKRLTGWFLLFLLSCIIYSIGYYQDPKVKSISGLERVIASLHFFLNLLAAPLTSSETLSWILGLIIFLTFSWISIIVFQKYQSQLPTYSAWISIGLFSIFCSILISVGRVDFGANYALSASRYTTHSILLIIAIIQIFANFLNPKTKVDYIRLKQNFYSFIAGFLACLVLFRGGEALTYSQLDLFYKQTGQTCLYLINYLEDSQFFQSSPERCLLRLSKTTWWIREGVEHLQNINLREFANSIPFIANPATVYGYIDSPLTTDKPILLKPDEPLHLRGWAILPESSEQPQLIFFSQGNQQSFFANAYVKLESLDLAEFLKSQRYKNSRWAVNLSATTLPIGETILKAWVFDPHEEAFMQLRGEVKVIHSID